MFTVYFQPIDLHVHVDHIDSKFLVFTYDIAGLENDVDI